VGYRNDVLGAELSWNRHIAGSRPLEWKQTPLWIC
jgi:hypothetical protein